MRECAQDPFCPLSLLFLSALSIVCECAICVCVYLNPIPMGQLHWLVPRLFFNLDDPSKGPAGQSISRDSACVCVCVSACVPFLVSLSLSLVLTRY